MSAQRIREIKALSKNCQSKLVNGPLIFRRGRETALRNCYAINASLAGYTEAVLPLEIVKVAFAAGLWCSACWGEIEARARGSVVSFNGEIVSWILPACKIRTALCREGPGMVELFYGGRF